MTLLGIEPRNPASHPTPPPQPHLVEPLPLEGDGEFEQDGNDAGEVNVTHDLEEGERERERLRPRAGSRSRHAHSADAASVPERGARAVGTYHDVVMSEKLQFRQVCGSWK